MEGIIPALESAHAVAYAIELAQTMPKDSKILVNLSGRGDKDIDYVMEHYPLVDYEPQEQETGFDEFLTHTRGK